MESPILIPDEEVDIFHSAISLSDGETEDLEAGSENDEAGSDVRNPTLKYPWFSMPEGIWFDCQISGKEQLLHIGETVELDRHSLGTNNARQGNFLRVKEIYMNSSTGEKKIRGLLFRRNKDANGFLPIRDDYLNEVYLVLNIDADDPRDSIVQSMYETSLQDIVCKRKLIITNKPFPLCSYKQNPSYNSQSATWEMTKYQILTSETLVCRYSVRKYFQTARIRADFSCDRQGAKPLEESLERVTWLTADAAHRQEDSELFRAWRPNYQRSHRLSFADCYCGCGGVSQGAKMAGLKRRWGLDKDDSACKTFRRNHCTDRNTICYYDDVGNLSTYNEGELYVDIVHASPPCQALSRANPLAGTRNPDTPGGQRDEANQSALFMIESLLLSTRARACVIEESDNLSLTTRHRDIFIGFINQFILMGWSVRWKIMDFAHYGLPQHRKRMIIFASCPGGVLPKFPLPTHGPGLRNDYRTIHDAISHLNPVRHTLHQPANMKHYDSAPYSEHILLRRGITTGGTTDLHPSGRRKFTIREHANLQGFPDSYDFYQRGRVVGEVMRQIGNAVPPIVAKVLLESVRDALEEEDWVRAEAVVDAAEAAANAMQID